MSSSLSKNNSQSSSDHREKQALIDELQFLGQMSSTETALFHQTAAARNGFGITDMKTISTLLQEGSMTAGQLAYRLSLTSGAVTSVIDRLEAAGMVQRESDPSDRRRVIVKVNVKKTQALGKVYDSIGQAFALLLERYSAAELKFLIEYYKLSVELTTQEIAKLSAKK